MEKLGTYAHALTAVLYAVRKSGRELDDIIAIIRQDIGSNRLRPRPQDQEIVVSLIATAVDDIQVNDRISARGLPAA